MCARAAPSAALSSPAWPASASPRRSLRSCSASRRRRPGAAAPRRTSRPGAAAAAPLKLLFWQGADAAEPALRHRRQGPGRRRALLRTARALRRRRQSRAGARRRDPEPRQRRHRRRRPLDDLEAQEGREAGTTASPFTADDVVFNWQYATDPATAAIDHRAPTKGSPRSIQGSTPRRCAFEFTEANADLGTASSPPVGLDAQAPVRGLRRRQVARGADQPASRSAPAPTRFVDFKPGDLRARRDQHATTTGRSGRYFDSVEMKGGGDATSAARAVLQTGEYDFAWNLQVEDEVLKRMEASGKGTRRRSCPSGDIEFIQLNHRRPVERGRRRARRAPKSQAHRDPRRRRRCARRWRCCSTGRASRSFVYGRAGVATRQLPQQPGALQQPERQGRVQRREGQRRCSTPPAGSAAPTACARRTARRLKLLLPDLDQLGCARRCRAIFKQACAKAGIELELKGGDGGGVLLLRRRQPRHLRQVPRRPADVRRRQGRRPTPSASCSGSCRGEVSPKANKWQGGNQRPLASTTSTTRLFRASRSRARSGQARGAAASR